MAATTFWYGNALLGQWSATAARRVNWTGDTIKCSLHTSGYTPNQDTHDFQDDLTNEVSGTGYTAGGVTLANKTATYDAASNEMRLDADDPAWTAVTITTRYAAFWVDTAGAAATDPLLAYMDFGGDQTVTGGNFTIVLAATGLLKVTAS